jgi:hypothetical protein
MKHFRPALIVLFVLFTFLVVVLFWNDRTQNEESKNVRFLLKEGYRGWVQFVWDVPTGRSLPKEGNWYTPLSILASAVLLAPL